MIRTYNSQKLRERDERLAAMIGLPPSDDAPYYHASREDCASLLEWIAAQDEDTRERFSAVIRKELRLDKWEVDAQELIKVLLTSPALVAEAADAILRGEEGGQ